MKCNPNPGLLAWLAPRVDLIDVSSIGEFRAAVAAGWSPERASFTGPGKREPEIAEALDIPVGTVRSRLHRIRRGLASQPVEESNR